MSSDEVAIANVYDEIVFARTLAAFDDLREILKDNLGCLERRRMQLIGIHPQICISRASVRGS